MCTLKARHILKILIKQSSEPTDTTCLTLKTSKEAF